MAPQLIFGTASFGGPQTAFQNADDVRTLLRALRDAGIQRLDTGARYPPTNMGRSEQLIGEAAKDEFADFIVDTKVFTDATKDGSGDLTEGAIGKSVDASLERLQRSSVSSLRNPSRDQISLTCSKPARSMSSTCIEQTLLLH